VGDKFKNDIEKFKKNEIDDRLIKIKRAIAREAFRRIVRRSPVSSGNYVKSHRVGISKTESGRGISRGHEPVLPFAFSNKVPEATAEGIKAQVLAKRIPYISRAKLHDVITISNSIPYAHIVEYVGWKKTSAYHVYGLTAQELELLPIQGTEIVF